MVCIWLTLGRCFILVVGGHWRVIGASKTGTLVIIRTVFLSGLSCVCALRTENSMHIIYRMCHRGSELKTMDNIEQGCSTQVNNCFKSWRLTLTLTTSVIRTHTHTHTHSGICGKRSTWHPLMINDLITWGKLTYMWSWTPGDFCKIRNVNVNVGSQ